MVNRSDLDCLAEQLNSDFLRRYENQCVRQQQVNLAYQQSLHTLQQYSAWYAAQSQYATHTLHQSRPWNWNLASQVPHPSGRCQLARQQSFHSTTSHTPSPTVSSFSLQSSNPAGMCLARSNGVHQGNPRIAQHEYPQNTQPVVSECPQPTNLWSTQTTTFNYEDSLQPSNIPGFQTRGSPSVQSNVRESIQLPSQGDSVASYLSFPCVQSESFQPTSPSAADSATSSIQASQAQNLRASSLPVQMEVQILLDIQVG